MKRYITTLGLIGALGFLALTPGCFPANQDPLAAASAAAKIIDALEGASSDADALLALANALATLTPAELASAVNLISGAGWSLTDAESILQLFAQFDEETIAQLAEIDFGEGALTDGQIWQALTDAGVTVTEEQVILLRQLFGVFESSGSV